MLKDFEIVCEEKEKSLRLPPRFYLSSSSPHGLKRPTLYVDPRDGGEPICLLVIGHNEDGKIWLWRNEDKDCYRLKAIGLTLDDIKIAVS